MRLQFARPPRIALPFQRALAPIALIEALARNEALRKPESQRQIDDFSKIEYAKRVPEKSVRWITESTVADVAAAPAPKDYQ